MADYPPRREKPAKDGLFAAMLTAQQKTRFAIHNKIRGMVSLPGSGTIRTAPDAASKRMAGISEGIAPTTAQPLPQEILNKPISFIDIHKIVNLFARHLTLMCRGVLFLVSVFRHYLVYLYAI